MFNFRSEMSLLNSTLNLFIQSSKKNPQVQICSQQCPKKSSPQKKSFWRATANIFAECLKNKNTVVFSPRNKKQTFYLSKCSFAQVNIRYDIFNQKIFQSNSGANFKNFSKKVSFISEYSSRGVDRTFVQNNQSFLFPDVGKNLEICFSVRNTCSPKKCFRTPKNIFWQR